MKEGTTVDRKMGWIWRKGVSVGKKVLAAGFLVSATPFLVPPLVVASIIALIASIPSWIFLACYVCTEKLMRKLLPATALGGRSDKMMVLPNKIGHGDHIYDEGIAQVAMMSEPVFVHTEEEYRETPLRVANIGVDVYQSPEDMRKESKSLLESIRDESRTNQSHDRGISEKAFEKKGKELTDPSDAKSEKIGAGKKKVSGARHEGEHESTTTEVSRGKYMAKSSDEVKVLYSEEQIWAKMEALRKIVGYSVARSTTYSEELKALYMFTGVELPTSVFVKEDQDIAQVSERLFFLMSVIGIK